MSNVAAFPGTPATREPPQNMEAEQELLGAILVNNAAYGRVSEFLRPEHFYHPLHGEVYRALSVVIERGGTATWASLKAYFETVKSGVPEIEAAGGMAAYVARLRGAAATVIHTAEHGRLIFDLHQRRQLIAFGHDLIEEAHNLDPESPTNESLERADAALTQIMSEGSMGSGLRPIAVGLQAAMTMTEAAYKRGDAIAGVPTGLTKLDTALGGLRPGNFIVIGARPSMGKAQPLHARIKTITGWKTMADIAAGDVLASPDGQHSVVTGKFPQGVKPIFRVTFHDGRSVECCDDHLWQVTVKGKRRVLPLKEIRRLMGLVRYSGRIAVEPITGAFGDMAPLPMPAYLLGALIGDGSLVGNFSLTSADAHLVERCGSLLHADYHMNYVANLRYDVVKRRRGGPSIYRDAIRALGLEGKPSNAKFIPADYLAARYEDRLELMRGLLDTDGTVERDGTIRFCTVSRQLAHDMRELAWSLGGVVRISEKRPHYTHNGERRAGQLSYVVSIRHNDLPLLLTLPRKLARLSKNPNLRRVRVRIASVEEMGAAEACCISVSHPDGLYITDHYIPTHNTTIALTMARNAARAMAEDKVPPGIGKGVAVFELEMSQEEVSVVLLAGITGISAERQLSGQVTEHEFERLDKARRRLAELPLYIDDTPGQTVAAIRARCRAMKRKGQLGLIVVDYLQLISVPNRRNNGNRTEDVSEITRALKCLAKELGVAVIALSQLSRKVEDRTPPKPQLSDLRESGSIEQDADATIFIYRPEYYLERNEPAPGDKNRADWEASMEACRDITDMIVAKGRMVRTGTVKIYYNAGISRVMNLADRPAQREGFDL